MNADKQWPAWYNGPNGETRIFNSADEVPKGWTTGAEKRSAGPASPAPAPSPSPPVPASEAKPVNAAGAELDAHGHPWSGALHAASKSKTTAGLWRLKVGASRPDPLPGYPKPPLDL